jgi:hypothetical protein
MPFEINADSSTCLNASDGKETVAEETAEVLGKRWRFFPTYAVLQTGTVLRHISSNA